ncbi:MAG: type II secretion system protein GspM [Candidatus Aureabacteria bacterium]|nr:type II secretion system protein GspM [Candidatus Auribacterota bacterium]
MKKISKREKKLIGIAGAAIAGFLIYQYAITPFLDYCERIRTDIPQMQKDLLRVCVIQLQYAALDKNIREIRSRLEERTAEFKPHDFLSTLAKKEAILPNLDKIELEQKEVSDAYEEQIAGVRLKHISLDKLVSYLYGIENSGQLITVKDLSIKPDSDDSRFLEVKFNASTFVKLKKKEGEVEKKPPVRKHHPRKA